jgi:hypothetical protein
MSTELFLLLSFLILTTPSAAGTTVEVLKLIFFEHALSKVKITSMLNEVINRLLEWIICIAFILLEHIEQANVLIVIKNIKENKII